MTQLMLPDEIISQVSVKDLIIARNNTFHELGKMRRAVLSSLDTLVKEGYEEDFQREAEKYIKKEFEPMLKSYYSRYWDLLAKFTNSTVTFSSTAVGTAIGLSQALSPLEIVFWSGISATVGSAASNLADYIVRSSKAKFRNSFSYLLNLREISSS